MKRTKYFDPSFHLTASELFFFDVQGVNMDNPMTYESGNWVQPLFSPPRQDPEYMMILTALLANTQIGSLQMEVNKKRTLLGLGLRRNAFASLTKEPGTWPPYSLESDLLRVVASINKDGRCQISDLVNEWLELLDKKATWPKRQQGRPKRKAVEFVQEQLFKRGYINKIEKKGFLWGYYFEYFPKEEILHHVNEERIQLIKKMLSDCKNSQPELWETAFRDIRDAFIKRENNWFQSFS